MKLVFENKNDDKYFKCNVCGDLFIWSKHSCFYELSVGKDYTGYDIHYTCCSKECEDKAINENLMDKLKKHHRYDTVHNHFESTK